MKDRREKWRKVWPAYVPREFEVDKPIQEYLSSVSLRFPEGVALNFYGRQFTYAQLDELCDRFAHALIGLGVRTGNRVGLYMQNCPQFVVSFFGVLRAGGVVAALNPMFRSTEVQHQLVDSGARTLVSLDYLYPEVRRIRSDTGLENVILTSLRDYAPEDPSLTLPPEFGESKRSFPETLDFPELLREPAQRLLPKVANLKNELALLQYTGGTTGMPKGAMIDHHALAYTAVGASYWFRNTEDDVHLGVTPFFHLMGMLVSMCCPLLSGGQVVILSRFVPEVIARAIGQYKCTAWVAAPTMLIALFQLQEIERYDLGSFRYICTGGAPIAVETQAKVKERAPNALIVEGYGLTESIAHGGTTTPPGRYKPGFVGIPQLNDVRIVDLETGTRELDANEEGEIVIKGPALMKGYWNRPNETAEVLKDGWFYTGDIGLMDEEGYLKIVGRKKELILCSGYNVYPSEVESLFYRHPAVAEVGVVGVPDPYRGESPKAFVVLKPEYVGKVREEEFVEWCKENMAAYKRPREVVFRGDLPKSAAGKILRRSLLEEDRSDAKERG